MEQSSRQSCRKQEIKLEEIKINQEMSHEVKQEVKKEVNKEVTQEVEK